MSKQIKDYLHFYFGNEMEMKFDDGSLGILRLDYYFFKAILTDWIIERPVPTSVKLVLRPLSSMTTEEMCESIKIGQLHYRGESVNEFTSKWGAFSPDVTRYLLKQGFDLFGLIDAGLAIDKTTINQQ